MKKRMWELKESAKQDTLDLYIYGDVTDLDIDWTNWRYVESENSAKHFREELDAHKEVKQINVYINSYGGSVFEGTAIYNQLRRHAAHKTVYVDGFACSIASVIAMAGDTVIMPRNAMMMVHNMYLGAVGNAKELRKEADDLDVLMQGNRQAYLQKCGDKLTEETLIEMLNSETWLTAEQCMQYGFADEYAEQDADLTQAKEMLQKANLSMQQRIDFQKSLAAQLRQLVNEPEPQPEPKQENKPLKFLSALMR